MAKRERTARFKGFGDRLTSWRGVTQTVDQLRAWIAHAGPHVQLALAIGALMPALRKATILSLRWDRHLDRDLRFVTISDRKGDQANPEPVTQPISDQLRTILETARAMAKPKKPSMMNVVLFRGQPVQSITRGLRAAAARAGIPYGTAAGGATFHTLRHTMATMLAELGVPESHRKHALAHADVKTTQLYTHLRPLHLVGPLEQLSAAVQVSDVMGQGVAGKIAGQAQATGAGAQGTQPTAAERSKRPKTQKRPITTGGSRARPRAS